MLIYDILSVYISSYLSIYVRFAWEKSIESMTYWQNVSQSIFITIILTIMLFGFLRLYSKLWAYADSFDFLTIIGGGICATIIHSTVLFVTHFVQYNTLDFYIVPRSYHLFYLIIIIAFVSIGRLGVPFLGKILKRNLQKHKGNRVMVIGAGDAGNILIREIKDSRYVKKRVVCIIDDDVKKIGNYIQGIKIVGGRDCILKYADCLKIDEIILALPAACEKDTKEILDICKESRCKLKILPGIYQIVNNEININRLREVELEDLLGRSPIYTDNSTIENSIRGQTVLISGAGGSIGSELCRQIVAKHPKKMVLLDIYENTTYTVQLELEEKFPDLELIVRIGSVRDSSLICKIFEEFNPDIVFHAAAHKHVPLMETSPNEAVKNNVLGTWEIVKTSISYNVKKFVLISTDKAVNPTNVMGATKRICEMMIQYYNGITSTDFVAVRFGNVLGSNGSVVPIFKKQIENGGPLTVTDTKIERYFMTITEAVSLVLQASVHAQGGEIFILDMGKPVKILDMAENLIKLSGLRPYVDIDIQIVGMRSGEKLYEELLMKEEGLKETDNKLIYIGKPIEFDKNYFIQQLKELEEYANRESKNIREIIKNIVSTYEFN